MNAPRFVRWHDGFDDRNIRTLNADGSWTAWPRAAAEQLYIELGQLLRDAPTPTITTGTTP